MYAELMDTIDDQFKMFSFANDKEFSQLERVYYSIDETTGYINTTGVSES